MQKITNYFYGFLVGVGLTIIPIPSWDHTITDIIEPFLRSLGFIIAIVFAILLIIRIVKDSLSKELEE